FFQAEDGIRDFHVTGVQTCALPISDRPRKVLYVVFENDPRGDIRSRLEDMGYGPDQLDRLVYLSFPQLSALDSPTGGAQLMAARSEERRVGKECRARLSTNN